MKTLTKEQLAGRLNGSHYLEEVPQELAAEAAENNLAILTGLEADHLSIPGGFFGRCGADQDMIETVLLKPGETAYDAQEQRDVVITEFTLLEIHPGYVAPANARLIFAEWWKAAKGTGAEQPALRITTDLPHSSFRRCDGEEIVCEGIVIDLDEIP